MSTPQNNSRNFLKFLVASIFFSLFFVPLPTLAIFDMHEHYRAGGKMPRFLQVSKKLGITHTLFVPTGGSPDNQGYKAHMRQLLAMKKKYPEKIIAFCTVNDEDPKAPEIFEKCLDDGGQGIKLLYGHPDFYDTPLNSEIAKKLFEVANRRDVPVLVHVSIFRSPSMNAEFRSLMDEFPNTRLQFAHYCSTVYDGVHTELCAEYLERYPNMMIDISMGGGLPRYLKYFQNPADRQKVRDFLLKYQDRILYGTDIILAVSGHSTSPKWIRTRMQCDFDLLGKEEARCSLAKGFEDVSVPGLALPKEVLEKLYEKNPRRFLRLEE